MEDRLQKVRYLINSVKVNAFVCKGKNGLEDLSKAVIRVCITRLFFMGYFLDKLFSFVYGNKIMSTILLSHRTNVHTS